MLSRHNNASLEVRIDPSSKMNDRWRSADELAEKMTKLKAQKRAAKEKLKRMECKIKELIDRDSIEVNILADIIIMYGAYSQSAHAHAWGIATQ